MGLEARRGSRQATTTTGREAERLAERSATTRARLRAQVRADIDRAVIGEVRAQTRDLRAVEREVGEVLAELEVKVGRYEAIHAITQLLNSSLDPAFIREKTLESTCRLLGCQTASLLLVDPERAELYWETALGPVGQELMRSVRLPIDDRSIAGWVAMTGEAVLINDVPADPRYNKRAAKSGFVTRTMVCVPLRSREKVVGVLQALNKQDETSGEVTAEARFHERDRALLEALSHPVGIAVENSMLYSQLKRGFYETVEALAEAIEKKDRYTGGHTKRVVYYALCIAKYMDLTPEMMEQLRLSAVLHDVGKIGIEDSILKKPSALERDEWKVMQTHPEIGFEIMNRVPQLREVVGGMRFHHERWDGKGYPLGLKGEEIPLLARIIAVADTYDAMVSTRPYRKGLDPKIAFEEITKYRDAQFDPRVVDAFIEAFRSEKMGKGSGGSNLSNMD